MGLKPRILVADLEIIKQVLVKDISIFTNRPVTHYNIAVINSLVLNLVCFRTYLVEYQRWFP